jgi:hypothetical protein
MRHRLRGDLTPTHLRVFGRPVTLIRSLNRPEDARIGMSPLVRSILDSVGLRLICLAHGPSRAAGTTATPSFRRYASGPVVTMTLSKRLFPI